MPKIRELLEGYRKFYDSYFVKDDHLFRDQLSKGQAPKTLIIGCSDSRSDPSIIMNAKPGDIFSVRNVANMVPPFTDSPKGLHGVSAALEFGVTSVGVEDIIVLGHSGCAGVKALYEGVQEACFVKNWVSIGNAAREKALKSKEKDKITICEQESILVSLENLMTFPFIKERVEAGTLRLHGWYFSIKNGSLKAYDRELGEFRAVPQ